MKNLYIYNLYVKYGMQNKFPDVFSKKGVLLQLCFIFLEEYLYRSVISAELNSHFCMDDLL